MQGKSCRTQEPGESALREIKQAGYLLVVLIKSGENLEVPRRRDGAGIERRVSFHGPHRLLLKTHGTRKEGA